jgi:tetratricopeptide (TPR) repeat protein
MGALLTELGRSDEAREALERALQLAQANGARLYELEAVLGLGMVEIDAGNVDTAEALLNTARDIAGEMGKPASEASAVAWLAVAHQLRGDDVAALSLFDKALAIARAANMRWREAHVLAHRSAILASDSATLEEANRGFADAEAIAERMGDPGLKATVDILKGGSVTDGPPGLNARVAARIAQHSRTSPQRDAGRMNPPSGTEKAVWTFAPSGKWFARGSDARVELFTRKPLQRIVKRLVDHHIAAAAEGLSVEDLFAAGWPGERIGGRSGSSRVYNALTTLKKLGLNPILLRRNDGYVLDPDVRIALADASPRPPQG